MRKLLFAAIILSIVACKKKKVFEKQTGPGETKTRCGVILQTPVLDSFVYPTYYITTEVAFDGGVEVVHFHADVTGDHDGSWYLPRYDKDSSFCTK
jgi:hypothetical protein